MAEGHRTRVSGRLARLGRGNAGPGAATPGWPGKPAGRSREVGAGTHHPAPAAGRPAPPQQIRELVGLPEGAEVVAYCHSGSRSALATLALRAAGYDARNYAGSWHEWSRHDELPLER